MRSLAHCRTKLLINLSKERKKERKKKKDRKLFLEIRNSGWDYLNRLQTFVDKSSDSCPMRKQNKTRQKSLANWLRSFPPTVTSFRKNRVPRRCRQHQFSMTLERSGQYVSLIWLVSHPTGTAARYLVQTHTYNSYTTEDNKFYSLSSCCCWNWRNCTSGKNINQMKILQSAASSAAAVALL